MTLLESYENICPLNKFIKRLYEDVNLNLYAQDSILQQIMNSRNDTIKIIGSKLYRNYKTIGSDKRVNITNSCSYLNYWIDEQKSIHITGESGVDISLWQLIEDLWNTLENDESLKNNCKRIKAKNGIAERKKNMDLMVYCENRDYLKDMCQKIIRSSNNRYCSILPQYIDKYYKIFFQDNNCIKGNTNDKDDKIHISEYCTLYNISKTFPEYDFHNSKILGKTNSRTAIPECRSTAHLESPDRMYGEEIHTYSGETSSSPNSESWKSVFYVGISSFGFFFFLFFLYRRTSLGPLLRSFIIKQKKLSVHVDEQRQDNVLENLSGYIDCSSEGNEYNFSYNPLQN
ncbi:PIR Superfamily Protein [Plasmodium ovale wallikeri]|uniref:PIR Superfamily Protein n=1 Tax=Plasmodium ovale wallikeri TaxID=864142 RepID=A0A1A9AID2_PLAOA|nr:PIR Superfamily Protein [Plasmodium ovale wallikeri]